MVLGSEGRLGIITEATVHVRPIPEQRKILGYLFPTSSDGLDAMRDIAASDCSVVGDPGLRRARDAVLVRDALEPDAPGQVSVQGAARVPCASARVTTSTNVPVVHRLRGERGHVAEQRKKVGKIVKRHGGLCIGSGPGALYDQKKFDTPYIRDFLLDRGAAGDVSETATPWSRLLPVYDAVGAAAYGAFAQVGVQGYLMCHLSHSYHAGACLYFTFAFVPTPGGDMAAEYAVSSPPSSRRSSTTARRCHIITPWAPSTRSGSSRTSRHPGVAMLEALFAGTDPGRHLNPGKIV